MAAFGDRATNVTDHVAADGNNNVAITADVRDLTALREQMASPPPENAAAAERHGVIQRVMAYIERCLPASLPGHVELPSTVGF